MRASEADGNGAKVSAVAADCEDDGVASEGECRVFVKAGAGGATCEAEATGSGWD